MRRAGAGRGRGGASVNLKVPLVVRMEGTNVDKGKQILKDSGIKVIAANDMADAARRVVEAIGQSV